MQTIDEIIINWFNSDFGTNFSKGIVGNLVFIFISLLLAAVLTGFIGLEREVHGHSAGLRTHLLVSIGSALIMIISIYGFRFWDANYLPSTSRDPARLAAQVVAGIGFIGAGAIVKNGISVRGLTTATTLWISMAIGLACGSGSFVTAIIATVVAIVALMVMRSVERAAAKKNPIIFIIFPSDRPIVKELLLIAQRYGITFREQTSELIEYQDNSAVRIMLRLSSNAPTTVAGFVEEVRNTLKPFEVKVQAEN